MLVFACVLKANQSISHVALSIEALINLIKLNSMVDPLLEIVKISNQKLSGFFMLIKIFIVLQQLQIRHKTYKNSSLLKFYGKRLIR